jgi:hypothetical protein
MSKSFATLTKATFPCYFKVVLTQIIEIVGNCHIHNGLNILTERAADRDMEIMVEAQLQRMKGVRTTISLPIFP